MVLGTSLEAHSDIGSKKAEADFKDRVFYSMVIIGGSHSFEAILEETNTHLKRE